MKIMFCILGEGRGHMTQAIAVKEIVEWAGHEVVSVVLGMGSHRQVPPFFASAMSTPIHRIPTLDFAFKNNQQVNLAGTAAKVLRCLPEYRRGLRVLKAAVRESRPDVILNFFEPLTGIYALTTRKRPPVLAIAHQFMYEHPDYVRAPGLRLQQWVMKWYIRLVGARSMRLALSLYSAPDLPGKNLRVGPPLLRRQLFELHPQAGDFVLVYLLNHGYARQIIEWHQRNPRVALHCFYDKPGAPAEERLDETLTFHSLDGEKFLRMMARCRHVASTAGFESLCEAAYLGKPLFLVPVENHVEQQINALDATRAGLGLADRSFQFDRLSELPDRLDNGPFRSWLGRADAICLQSLEQAAAGPQAQPHRRHHWNPQHSKAA